MATKSRTRAGAGPRPPSNPTAPLGLKPLLWPSRPTWLSDAPLALGVFLAELGATFAAHHRQPDARSLDALGVLLLAIGPLALTFRRRRPVASLATAFVGTFAFAVVGYPSGPHFIALVVAFVNGVVTGHRRAAQVSLVAGYLAFLWIRPLARGEHLPGAPAALGLMAWLLFLLSIAEFARLRRERAVEAERSREEESRRRVTEERLRIARELHDVVAHNMSLINVQASTALHLIEAQPHQARLALGTIKDASKEALVELRSVLGVLRGVDEDDLRSPTPGLDRLSELVTTSAASGLTVGVVIEGDPRLLGPAADTAAYRIVQEALTNVGRHAGVDRASVHLHYGATDVVVQVDDDGINERAAGSAHAAPVPPGLGGNGIQGMRERAAALGGTLTAGPRYDGGFRVRAWLPDDGVAP